MNLISMKNTETHLLCPSELKFSSALTEIKDIASISKLDFQKDIATQTGKTQKLFETVREVIHANPVAKTQAREMIKLDSKVILARFTESSLDEEIKKGACSVIEQVLLSLKSEKFSGPSPALLAHRDSYDIKKKICEKLWNFCLSRASKHYGPYTTLRFSDEIKDKIDDHQLGLFLKENPSRAKLITNFDFREYPKLSPEAPKILIEHCPKIGLRSFRGTAMPQYSDHVLLAGDLKIPINKGVLSHFSPYFKEMFNFKSRANQNVNETVLTGDEQAIKDCMESIMGNYSIGNEEDINRVLAFLDTLLFFQIPELVDFAEKTVIRIFDKIQMDNPDNLEEIVCDINNKFYPYFVNRKELPHLDRELQWIANKILRFNAKVSPEYKDTLEEIRKRATVLVDPNLNFFERHHEYIYF